MPHASRNLWPALAGFVAGGVLAWTACAADSTYFRSDAGVAAPGSGPLPADLDAPDTLCWRVPLEPGHSTPILADGRIFLTTYRAASRELATVALDQRSGRTLWRRAITVQHVEQTHPLGSPATATPACDGRRVFVFFGSHGLMAYGLDGRQLWDRPLGPFQDEYGAGSSPVLVGDRVVINQDHDTGSFLAAFDAATGQLIWKTARPDAVRSYSTPALWTHNGHSELLVAGALELAAYDPADGRRLWWINGLARIVIPTPVPAGERIYMASWAPGGDTGRRLALDAWPAALAKWDKNHDGKLSKAEIGDPEVLDRFYRMDLDQNGVLDEQEWNRHAEVFRRAQNAVLALQPSTDRGELPAGDVLWKYQRGIPYVATPLLDRGILWMAKEGGIVTRLDAADGRVLSTERAAGIGNYFASPVAGGGKVYLASEPGVVSVVAEQPDWKVISSRNFHERIYATPVIAGDRIYLRTEQALYCFRGL
ncbi:MAG: PQQ-binding-like beta-propeller repeat protein [Verrucomicrobia bacterium]|nr:PQQ-binding-like beta-propeller repeat protein [Verrucomicrobiota bacterium]